MHSPPDDNLGAYGLLALAADPLDMSIFPRTYPLKFCSEPCKENKAARQMRPTCIGVTCLNHILFWQQRADERCLTTLGLQAVRNFRNQKPGQTQPFHGLRNMFRIGEPIQRIG